MCPSSDYPCNRVPFASESGCDRGSVDVHQFDDFPYCGKISPTLPKIPPEIVEKTVNLPIPPPCNCFNIAYKGSFGYTGDRTFSASAEFRTQSGTDCCDGLYETRFRLNLPCPVFGDDEPKKVRMKIGYGDSGASFSDSYIRANSSSCEIEAKDIDVNLNLPCPVGDSGGSLSIGIGYGHGPSRKRVKIVEADHASCTIRAVSASMNLNLPCPVVGRTETKKISAKIQYGSGETSDSASLIGVDADDCWIRPYSPSLNLNLPCPVEAVEEAPKIKIGISYGSGKGTASGEFLETDHEACTIKGVDTNLLLHIGCPVKTWGNAEGVLRLGISYGSGRQSGSARYIEGNPTDCVIRPTEPRIMLNMPCPVVGEPGPRRLRASMTYGSVGSTSISYATVYSDGCGVELLEPTMYLSVPCPIRMEKKKYRKQLKVKASIQYGSNSYDSTSPSSSSASLPMTNGAGSSVYGVYMTQGNYECSYVFHECNLNLRIPCPIKLDSSSGSAPDGQVRIRANIKYYEDISGSDEPCAGSSISAQLGTMSSGCEMEIKKDVYLSFRLHMPPPSGAFSIVDCQIVNRHFYAEHRIIDVGGSTVAADGPWYLKVNHNNLEGATLGQSCTSSDNDDNHTCIKLFEVKDCKIIDDYRGMPFIPIYA